MFMYRIIDLINKPTMLVLIPRIATALFILLQIAGMIVYPGGTLHDTSTTGYSFTIIFFLIWAPMSHVMVIQTIYQ